MGVGGLACFVGGCCYGIPTSLPWAVDFGDGVTRHPTQLYEFAFHATAAAVLFTLQQRQLLRDQLIKLYIIAYLAFRFATEFIRPEQVLWVGLTGYQLASLALIPPFILLWVQDVTSLTRQPAWRGGHELDDTGRQQGSVVPPHELPQPSCKIDQ